METGCSKLLAFSSSQSTTVFSGRGAQCHARQPCGFDILLALDKTIALSRHLRASRRPPEADPCIALAWAPLFIAVTATSPPPSPPHPALVMGAAVSSQAYDSPDQVAAKLARRQPCVLAFLSPQCGLCSSLRPALDQVRVLSQTRWFSASDSGEHAQQVHLKPAVCLHTRWPAAERQAARPFK